MHKRSCGRLSIDSSKNNQDEQHSDGRAGGLTGCKYSLEGGSAQQENPFLRHEPRPVNAHVPYKNRYQLLKHLCEACAGIYAEGRPGIGQVSCPGSQLGPALPVSIRWAGHRQIYHANIRKQKCSLQSALAALMFASRHLAAIAMHTQAPALLRAGVQGPH